MSRPEKDEGMRVRRVHLVRHGEVENVSGVVYGRLPGFGLSASGRRQTREAADKLAAEVGSSVVIVSSPLERARETAALIHERLVERDPSIKTVEIDERLIEAGSPFDGLPRRFAPLAYARRWLDASARRNGESPRAVARRMREAVSALAPDATDVILVSHQFPIHMAVVAYERGTGGPGASSLAERAPWLFVRGRSKHASITTLSFGTSDRPTISYWEPSRSHR